MIEFTKGIKDLLLMYLMGIILWICLKMMSQEHKVTLFEAIENMKDFDK